MSKSFSYPVWNILHLERGVREPLQGQIFHQLRAAITIGQIERGARLPPSRMLAKELGIARNTVTNIYDRLAAEGYLLHKVGSGTFVEAVIPEDHQMKSGQQVSPRASPMAPSQRGQAILAMQVPWGRMDQFALSPGLPALDQFPFERFAELSAQHWRSRTTIDLGYGEGGGLHALKEQIALYLREARGVCCDAEQVIIVSHTLQAMTLVTQVLLDSGDAALVEDPSYIAELANLRAAGIRPISVPIDGEGLDLSAADVTAERAGRADHEPPVSAPITAAIAFGFANRSTLALSSGKPTLCPRIAEPFGSLTLDLATSAPRERCRRIFTAEMPSAWRACPATSARQIRSAASCSNSSDSITLKKWNYT